jgi:hypothetical protein
VLDGSNAHVPGQASKYGCQGYATLEFKGPRLAEIIHAPGGDEVFRQDLA